MKPWWLRLARYAAPSWRALVGIGLLMLTAAVLDALSRGR